eukprot:TRINITY_DN1160_c0_g1_i4.p1 TRINITY_DN1160_c0_g1~~TRINITY_DN1160_c0_g1_i4.p1  ORF type:complete len:301 (+),score=68.01 TRINITY_DN1160_c0_g1_i4:94-903(+)
MAASCASFDFEAQFHHAQEGYSDSQLRIDAPSHMDRRLHRKIAVCQKRFERYRCRTPPPPPPPPHVAVAAPVGAVAAASGSATVHGTAAASLGLSSAEYELVSGNVTELNVINTSVWCSQCGALFGDVNSLRRHASRAHRKSNCSVVICEQCHIAVRNEQNLKRHVAVCHSGEQSVACKRCPARFCSMTSLRKHQQKVHQLSKRVVKPRVQRSFVCDTCGDCFKWKGNLKRHMQLTHLNLRPWACTVCGAKFGTKSNMRVHLMTHAAKH